MKLMHIFCFQMYLKVEEAIHSIKSSILATSYDRSFYKEKRPPRQKKIWSGIEDGLKIFKLYRRFLVIEFAFTLVLATYFVLLFTYYQISIRNVENKGYYLLQSLVSTSIVLACGSILRYQARKQLALERRQQATSPFLLAIEITIILVQPYPYLNQMFVQRVSIGNQIINPLKMNHFLIVLSLIKLVFLVRGVLSYLTPYGNPRYFRVCKIYGVTNDPFYHMRSLFRQHPVITISILYIFSMLLFAYCYRVFQRGATQDTSLDQMQNTLWLALLTMTTVGYGDVKPNTSIGVFITVISSFTGVIGTSLLVLSITNNLQLNYGQQRSLQILRRFRNRRDHKSVSAMYIRVCLWRIWKEYKSNQKIQISSQERKLKRQLSEMNEQAKKSLKQSTLLQQIMQQQFELVRSQMNSILENYDNMLEDCSNKEQVIQGVLRNLGNYKVDLKKMELFIPVDESHRKTINLSAQMANCL